MVDESDREFAIKGSLRLISPDGGEAWPVGSEQEIKWERFGESMQEVKLEYSKDAGRDNYPYLSASNLNSADLSYRWVIPADASSEMRVKITLLDDPSTSDVSDRTFSVQQGMVLLRPVGSETWVSGSQENIVWDTFGPIERANLYYSIDGGLSFPYVIAKDISNIDGFLWTIPDTVTEQAKVKIESSADSSVSSASPLPFTVKK